jgi:cytochrome b pre-mRNA-processing protein 3
MMLSLFRKRPDREPVYAVYLAIVAQSRQPRFYADWGVPDTITGHFDMISLHLALLFRRLRAETPEVRAFSQAVFDLFFKDMDRSLREMGAGDLAVPKKIQKMGAMFYGLLDSIADALDRKDPAAIEGVLRRNLSGPGDLTGAAALAQYLLAESARLDGQPVDAIVAGRLATGVAA